MLRTELLRKWDNREYKMISHFSDKKILTSQCMEISRPVLDQRGRFHDLATHSKSAVGIERPEFASIRPSTALAMCCGNAPGFRSIQPTLIPRRRRTAALKNRQNAKTWKTRVPWFLDMLRGLPPSGDGLNSRHHDKDRFC